MMLSPQTRTRLEKAATDNGFDRELSPDAEWLAFASTQCPLRIWLSTFGDAVIMVAFSKQNVAGALVEFGTPMAAPLPSGALGGRTVTSIAGLHQLLRRAFQLSRTLPNELLHTFQKRIFSLPRTTEAERVVVQRVGQDIFREGLLDFWERRCAITGLAVPELLRASHIKPWAQCEGDSERLDVYNGLLLAPHLDLAFDKGFVTVADDGAVVVSSMLSPEDRRLVGLAEPLLVRALTDAHRRYLPWHRSNIFKQEAPARQEDEQAGDGD
jgi:putative restriction endonuclease